MRPQNTISIEQADKTSEAFFAEHQEIKVADLEFISHVKASPKIFDEKQREQISQFAKTGNQNGYLLLKNLTVDPHLPPTPTGKSLES